VLFTSPEAASEKTGVRAGLLLSAIKFPKYSFTGGYHWSFVYEETEPRPMPQKKSIEPKVKCYNRYKELLKEYESLDAAIEDTGIGRSTLATALRESPWYKRHKGFYWLVA
jgi:hypothetical protein